MTVNDPNIGPTSTRRRIATVIAVIGVLVVGRELANAWPRETPILYEVGPSVAELDADVLQEGEAVASARFRRPEASPGTLRHAPRLQPGRYELRVTIRGRDGSAFEEVRSLSVPAAGPTRIDLRGSGSAADGPEDSP
jgi:hypothetical protein